MKAEMISPVPYQVLGRGKPAKLMVKSDRRPVRGTFTVSAYGGSGGSARQINLFFEDMGDDTYTSDAVLPDGGWYALSLRLEARDGACDVTVEPVGCGEVFVIAGQSHATNSNNKQFLVTEPEGRITVCEPDNGGWRVAHDPQPCYDRSDYNARFGSIWPCAFDDLYRRIGVPVGMTNAAFGATALFQWQPGGEHFSRLVDRCRAAGNFRAILWQQGESDVMWRTETDAYVTGMLALKEALDEALVKNTKWLVAKSTIHPSVYQDREHEGKIRRAYELLYEHDGFFPGPDTDTLDGENRDSGAVSGHLTEAGQIAAGALWSDAIAEFLRREAGKA